MFQTDLVLWRKSPNAILFPGLVGVERLPPEITKENLKENLFSTKAKKKKKDGSGG